MSKVKYVQKKKKTPFLGNDTLKYGVLLLASLGLAWWASTPRSLTEGEAVRLASVHPSRITKITYKTANSGFTATRREGEEAFWIETTDSRFLAGERFTGTLGFFKPLEAKRMIAATSKFTEEQLKAFGLNPPMTTLTVETTDDKKDNSAKPLTIQFGTNSFGTTDRYGLSLDGKNVVLFEADMVAGYDNPVARFFDRTVLSARQITESDAAEIKKGASKKVFPRSDKKTGNAERPPFEGPVADWLEKYEKLRAIRFADQATEEKLSAREPELVLKLWKGDSVTSELAIKTLDNSWWVFSSAAKAHLEISANRAEPVVKDAESLL